VRISAAALSRTGCAAPSSVAQGLSSPLHGRFPQEEVDEVAAQEEKEQMVGLEAEEKEEGEKGVVVEGEEELVQVQTHAANECREYDACDAAGGWVEEGGLGRPAQDDGILRAEKRQSVVIVEEDREEKVRIPHLIPHRWIGLLVSSDSGEEDGEESGGDTRLSSVVQGPVGGAGQEQETDHILAHVEAHRGAASQESCSQTATQEACSQTDLCTISHSSRDMSHSTRHLLAPRTHPSLAILTPPSTPTSPRRLSVCGASSEGEECMQDVGADSMQYSKDVGADSWYKGPLGNECRLAAARQWTQEAPRQEVGGERAEVGGERAEVGGDRAEVGGERADAQQSMTRQLLPQEPAASFSPFRIPRMFLLGASWSSSDSSSEDSNKTHGTQNESALQHWQHWPHLPHLPPMTRLPGAQECIEGEKRREIEIPIIFSQRSSNQSSPHTPGTCTRASAHVHAQGCREAVK
jgi:hypothetical protein